MSRAWQKVERRRVWMWVLGLGSTSLPAMTYRHTYTAAGAELMKGDECAALVCFRCSRQGQDNWGTEELRRQGAATKR